tara:strand:- start:6377 stop:7114 length:738 start_codon:yes stop_codon:yes gene_type:complete
MLDALKSNLRYTNLHFAILNITNPNYIKWLKKELFFHKKFLNNENLIFDLGANLGDKTYIFSKLSKKIICFEPEDKMYKILKKRFRNKKIVLRKKIISNKIEKVKFIIVKGNEAYSTIIKKSLNQFKHLNKNDFYTKIKKSSTLNHEITKFGIPNYIKIDCEGSESKILKRLKYRVKIISFELNLPYFIKDGKEIIEFFKRKYNSKFNIRIQDKFQFYFKKNVSEKECLKFISKKNITVEVFVFS